MHGELNDLVARKTLDQRQWALDLLRRMGWPEAWIDNRQNARLEQMRRLLCRQEGEEIRAANLKLVLRVLAQEAPVQTALLLLGHDIADACHMKSFAEEAVIEARVTQACAILREAERWLDQAGDADVGRLASLLTQAVP